MQRVMVFGFGMEENITLQPGDDLKQGSCTSPHAGLSDGANLRLPTSDQPVLKIGEAMPMDFSTSFPKGLVVDSIRKMIVDPFSIAYTVVITDPGSKEQAPVPEMPLDTTEEIIKEIDQGYHESDQKALDTSGTSCKSVSLVEVIEAQDLLSSELLRIPLDLPEHYAINLNLLKGTFADGTPWIKATVRMITHEEDPMIISQSLRFGKGCTSC